VAVQPLTPALARELGLSEIQGLLVRAVEDGSPASTVGLAAGDVIVEVDRQPVQSAADLKQVVDKHRGGPPILLLVHRNGESVFVAVSV
jgi:S1-C subfamily serine protease